MVKITFKGPDFLQTVDANIGDTILEVAKKNGVKLYGGCDGSCICGSCHVHLEQDRIGIINNDSKKSDEEEDILDIIDNRVDSSRLACQVRITAELDGMIVVIPH